MGPFLHGAKIDGAAWCIKQPLIGVQFVHRGDNSLIGSRKALNGGRSLVAGDQLGGFRLIAFGGGCPANFSHTVMRDQSLVETPTLAIPS